MEREGAAVMFGCDRERSVAAIGQLSFKH